MILPAAQWIGGHALEPEAGAGLVFISMASIGQPSFLDHSNDYDYCVTQHDVFPKHLQVLHLPFFGDYGLTRSIGYLIKDTFSWVAV